MKETVSKKSRARSQFLKKFFLAFHLSASKRASLRRNKLHVIQSRHIAALFNVFSSLK
jgi:hypothetical protein